MNKQFHNTNIVDYFSVLSPWVLLFILIPFNMIGFSPEEYAFMDGNLLLIGSIVLTSIFTLISIALLIVSRNFKIDKYYLGLFHFSIIWFSLAGFLAPLVMKSGMVDPISTNINSVNVLAVSVSTAVLTWMLYSKLKHTVVVFLSIFILTSSISKSPAIYGILKSEMMGGFTALSKENNVIILSFDGIPGNYASRAIKEFPVLGAAFKDFVIYSNAVSASPSTALSITTELHGPIDLSKIGSTQRELYSKLDNSDLFLNNPKYNSYTYGGYGHFNTNRETAIPIGGLTDLPSKGAQLKEIFSFYDFVIVRIGTRYLLSFLNLFEHESFNLSSLLSKILRIEPLNEGRLEEKMKHHTGTAEWDLKNILTYNDYVNMVSNLTADALRPSVRHMHFTFTHYPVDFDINCEYQSHNRDWHTSNQNHRGAYNETVGALFKLAEFIAKLKQLNIYDQSFLVIKSDHGKPPGYYNEAPYNYKINGNINWGIGRYMPMLMIKTENNNQPEAEIMDQFVSLTDLAYTLSKRYMPEALSDSSPGIDLLSLREPQRTDLTDDIFLYIPEHRLTSFAYEDLKSIKVERGQNLYESLKGHESVSLKIREPTIQDYDDGSVMESNDETSLSLGILLKFNEHSSLYATYGMAGIEPWGRWSNGKICGLKFVLSEAAGKPSSIVLTASGFVTIEHPVQQVEIFLNGSIIGKIEFRHGGINPRDVTIDIPKDTLLYDKSNTIEFTIKNPISPKSLGLSDDDRQLGIGFRTLRFR